MNMNISNIHFQHSINSNVKSAVLSSLKIGDSFKAQVVDILSESILLRLTDGSIIQAGSLNPLQLEKGQNIVLTVEDKKDSQVFVKLSNSLNSKEIQSNGSMDYKERLLSMNMEPSGNHIEILKNLIRYNLPVTKEQISDIREILEKFTSITPDKVVFMLLNDMDINENNIKLLNDLINGNGNIENDILHLSRLLDENVVLNDGNATVETAKETVKVIKDNIEKLFIKVDGLKYQTENIKAEIAKRLSDISQVIEVLRNIAAQGIIKNKEFISKFHQLEEKLNFMKQVNNHFIYLPIPVSVNQKNTFTELYIMRNKQKKKNLDPSNATLLLSLSTQNLGVLEILVKVYKKTVECHFTADSVEHLDFVKKNITSLYTLLEAEGYKLIKVNYKQREGQSNVLEMVEPFPSENANYSFDIKV